MGRTGRAHFIILTLALIDLFAYLNWGISFRGQLFDILLSVLPLITASNVLFNRFRRLPLAGKVYFVAMPVINLLLTPIYLLGTIVFPLTTLDEARGYEVRERPGVLSPPAANLIKKTFVFERLVSGNLDYDIENSPNAGVRLVFKKDSVGLVLPQYQQPNRVVFFRR